MTTPTTEAVPTDVPVLKTYEFINPSDNILFDAPSDEVAALAALYVGGGKCSAKNVADPEWNVIGFAMFGGDGGYKENYGRDMVEGFNALTPEVVTACHSFRLASGGEPTSLSDWCAYAHGAVYNPKTGAAT